MNMLKQLTTEQASKATDLLKYYKYIYHCNFCGAMYGADLLEKNRMCPHCENNLEQTKRKKKREDKAKENIK